MSGDRGLVTSLVPDDVTARSPAEVLLALVDPRVGASVDVDALERELQAHQQRARLAWPSLDLDPVEFAAHLGRHCSDPRDLASMNVEDLCLTLACMLRHEEALTELLERLALVVERMVPRDGDDLDEVRLIVTQRLLIDDPPKISTYGGRGSLEQWLAAAVAREAISRRRTAARRRALLEQAGEQLAPNDPELGFLKAHYRGEFKAAFAEALAALEPSDRTVLRHRFVDGLTLDQLAAASGVHRATAARWLARIRASLLESTRSGLRRRLGLEAPEIDSILRLIASNFEVSVRRLLG